MRFFFTSLVKTMFSNKWPSPKKLFTLLDLCVSSLRRGHANLLCIVPILTDDPRRESKKDAIERRIVRRVRESDRKNGLNEVTHSQSLQAKCLLDACWVLAGCLLEDAVRSRQMRTKTKSVLELTTAS